MHEIILAAIGGFLLGYLYRRDSWRVENWLAARWPTRCAKCGVRLQTRNALPAHRTTGEYVSLCAACWRDEYTPLAPKT